MTPDSPHTHANLSIDFYTFWKEQQEWKTYYKQHVDWKEVVTPFNPAHVTPAGYDFSVGSISRIGSRGELFRDDKILPIYFEMKHEVFPDDLVSDMYYLRGVGSYIVTFNETVKIPEGFTGLMWSRSSLIRMGANLHTAIWDSGYEGKSSSLLVVNTPYSIRIQQDARIGHMILVPVATDQYGQSYNGSYQKEGVA